MEEFVMIPLTEEMKMEYVECAKLMDESGVEKDCDGCGLNGGDFGCLGEYPWRKESAGEGRIEFRAE